MNRGCLQKWAKHPTSPRLALAEHLLRLWHEGANNPVEGWKDGLNRKRKGLIQTVPCSKQQITFSTKVLRNNPSHSSLSSARPQSLNAFYPKMTEKEVLITKDDDSDAWFPDIIVGVDFGMTYTGRLARDKLTGQPEGFCSAIS